MVYRPPKQKPAVSGATPNRSGTDVLANPTLKPGAAAGVLPGDDRHLVAVDENYTGGDSEDRLWLFWRKQKNKIYGVICVASVGIIIWQGWNIYQSHVEANLQAEFSAAADAPALAAFAQAHADTVLGKLAQLESADTLYKAGKFKDAADAYAKAVTMLADDDKSARARLGQAMSLLQAGDVHGGTQTMEALTNDTSAVENMRAEAAFDLAILAAQAGDKDTTTKWLNHLKEFKDSNIWGGQAATLSEILPLLGDVKLVSGGAISTTPKITALPAPAVNATSATKSAAPSTTPAPAVPPVMAVPPASAPATTATAAPKAAPGGFTGFSIPSVPEVK